MTAVLVFLSHHYVIWRQDVEIDLIVLPKKITINAGKLASYKLISINAGKIVPLIFTMNYRKAALHDLN